MPRYISHGRSDVGRVRKHNEDAYIIDDICDGGRTFIALAEEIRKRNVGKINLIVSHGILSYGEEPLRAGGIDHIYTTDSVRVIDSPYVTQITLRDILKA